MAWRQLMSRWSKILLLILLSGLLAACHKVVLDESSQEVGLYTSLQINAEGNPVVAYFDKRNRSPKLAVCTTPSCKDYVTSTIDDQGAVGSYPSLALTEEGLPVVSYYDLAKRGLKMAFCQDATCNQADYVLLDQGGRAGEFSSLALNSQGFPVISYYAAKEKDLKLAICHDPVCSDATIMVVDSEGEVGRSTSLALTADDRPVISYFDEGNTNLKLAICGDPLCDDVAIRTLDSGQAEIGEPNTLRLSADERPIVAYQYFDSQADPKIDAVKLAVCQDPACSEVRHTIVDQRQVRGDERFGNANAMTLNSKGNPVLVYWDSENHAVRIAVCKDESCERKSKRTARFDWGVQYLSVAVNSKDRVYFACYEVRPRRRRLVIYQPYLFGR